ncbi:hypothetical protein L198_01735 [Cryptococcus wingfieldii CBS 7118]|uniref:DUF221-domain-containing protein n=1 Tax=Cryptococcus wingfieldii CBS 7118 TaxID=1295528 RepID=A0A1E3K2R9_9TREE|nr:hypothetical protein L198_01735 [Cryptococcus wingfieldii CBS 7118]ODO06502.1 hypothetical protein L198_01735 [Cryptococcus wingfieldii CBS 7118]
MSANNADDALSSSPEDAASASTASFLTSLFMNSGIAGGAFVAFVIMRRWLKAIYEPRTYIPPTHKQAPVLGTHLLWPLWQILMADPEEILQKNGVDPYVFVRFTMMMAKAMVPIWLISWLVLLPVYSADSHVDGKEGLDKFTFGNVAKAKQSRYWAPLILDFIFIFWFFFVIWHEMKHWLVVRQRYLVSRSHSKLPQANTVLVTGIPNHYLNEKKLEQLFSHLPGGVKRTWLNRNLKEMPGFYDRREHATKLLESAQVKLIKIARRYKLRQEKKIEKLERKGKPIPAKLLGPANHRPHVSSKRDSVPQLPMLDFAADRKAGFSENGRSVETDEQLQVAEAPPSSAQELELVDRLVPHHKRPRHRIKPRWSPIRLGFLRLGHKVDTIEWCREEIALCTAELEKSRAKLMEDIEHPGKDDRYPPLSSAFIHFNQQIAAHMAAQCLTHNQPYTMNARYTEQSPPNVIWSNLSLNQYERNVRQAISWACTGGMIFAWTFPVAFIGALSSVSDLTSQFPWLSWIEGDTFDKKIIQGVLSGILPPVLLECLMMMLPVSLRHLAKFEGATNKTGVELDLMTRYFVFLIIHSFFVITLSAGLISSLETFASNPQAIATTLASQMPTASTFFITLVLTQFTGTMGTLLRLWKLSIYYVQVILLGGTPRSVYSTRYDLNHPQWGETFPGITVYAVMMIAYCVISPVINGFGAAFFIFATMVYKFHYIWVIDQPASSDTGGLFFPKAITHMFVGMYIQEICMAALFFLARDDNGKASALPQGGLMIVLGICTVFFQYTIVVQYGPLKHCLPLSLAHLSYGMPKEAHHEDSVIGEAYHDEGEKIGDGERKRDILRKFGNSHINFTPSRQPLIDRKAERQESGDTVEVDIVDEPSEISFSPTSPCSEKGKGGAIKRDREATLVGKTELSEKGTYLDDDRGPDVVAVPSPSRIFSSSPTKTRSRGSNISLSAPPYASRPSSPAPTTETYAVDNPEDGHASRRHHYFAVPGGPGVLHHKVEDEATAFFHPATKNPQMVIWLPEDELGLSKAEVEANMRAGVKSSLEGAWLNEKGSVQISKPPPDDQ